jgi:stress response protein YsnF
VSDNEEHLNSKNINFNEVLKKEAVGIDGLDLGKVIEVGDTYIVTQKGLIDKKKYYLPISSIEKFDGEFLNLKINEVDLKSYEKTEDTLFENYSSFKSSDMSNEVQTTIPLIDEKLEVTKKTIEENVQIVKETIKETKQVEVELRLDKISLIKRPIDNNVYDETNHQQIELNPSITPSNDKEVEDENFKDNNSPTEIILTIEREEPIIVKRSYLKEEIIVNREQVMETKTITEELIHEQIKYDNIEEDNISSK